MTPEMGKARAEAKRMLEIFEGYPTTDGVAISLGTLRTLYDAGGAQVDAGLHASQTVRDHLRLKMLDQPVSGKRETFSDGFAQGLAYAIQQIDAAFLQKGQANG